MLIKIINYIISNNLPDLGVGITEIGIERYPSPQRAFFVDFGQKRDDFRRNIRYLLFPAQAGNSLRLTGPSMTYGMIEKSSFFNLVFCFSHQFTGFFPGKSGRFFFRVLLVSIPTFIKCIGLTKLNEI